MSSCSRQSIANRWHSILTVTVACIACWSAVPSAPAQKSESPMVMALLVSLHDSAGIHADQRARTARPSGATSCRAHRLAAPDATASRRTPRRGKNSSRNFGQSNGVRRPSNARSKPPNTVSTRPCLPSIASSRASATTPTSNLIEATLHRTRANSRGGFLDNPRVKLDLDMMHGKPYVGVRVVIPFGN